MLKRQNGAATCHSCNRLVSVNAKECIHCGTHNPGLWGYSRAVRQLSNDFGFSILVIWGCISLYALSLTGGFALQKGGDFLVPTCKMLFLFGGTGAVPLFHYGRLWTVLSAGWLHGGIFHLVFNLLWINYLVPSVTRAYGAARLTTIYVVSIISGGLLTSFVFLLLPGQGAALAVGASGGLFGLFGSLVSYGQKTKDYDIRQQALTFTAVGFVYGLVMPGVDNWGHLGGFLGGYLITQLPWLNPQARQKLSDLVVAATGMSLVALSLMLSLVSSVWLLMKGIPLPPGCF